MPPTLDAEAAIPGDELTGLTLGQYELIEKAGRGGMASVYKARALERGGGIVAVKILTPQLAVDPTFRARFLREAEVLRKLRHPNIVPVFDFGEVEGYLFIVMPFMQVGGLSDRLRRGPLGVREGASIFRQIASALQYAHDKGIIHRDVKLSNILIDDGGNAWLSDFGFVHIDDANLSLTGSALVGTPAYIAPELVDGHSPSPLSDQYSLGVVLYQMSTGRLPYEAETPMAMAIKHMTEPLPRPRAVNPKLPDAVERVIMKVLSKDPAQRYESVEALCEAFEASISQSVDLASGAIKPGARGEDPITEVLDKPQLEAGKRPLRWRRWVGFAALMLLVCPLGTWLAFAALGGSIALRDTGTVVYSVDDVQETVVALATASAQPAGTLVPSGFIETAVHKTLTARESQDAATLASSDESSSGSTLSGTEGTAATNTGSETPHLGLEVSATPIGSGTVSTTPSPGATSTPLSTIPASKTPDPGSEPANTPTRTASATRSATPTSTRSITPTPSLTQTATTTRSPTPSATPTEDICALIVLDGFGVNKDNAVWLVTNNSSQTITITSIYLDWPIAGDIMKKVKFGGKEIWIVGDEDPPTHINSNWSGALKDRQLRYGKDADLEFEFELEPGSSGFDLEISFDLGCVLTSNP